MNTMKKILMSGLFMMFALVLRADKDVTNSYIENPDFEARFAGWFNNGFYYVTNSSFSQKNTFDIIKEIDTALF